jgi:leucyl aminopeptidase
MKLQTASAEALKAATPLAVLLVDESKPAKLPGGTLGTRAAALMRRKVFTGKLRKTLLLHNEAAGGPRALLLIGMGKAKSLVPEDYRRAGAIAVNTAAGLEATRLVIGAVGGCKPGKDDIEALGEGAVLAGYRYRERPAKTKPPREVRIVSGLRGAAGVLKTARVLAESANLARELGDLPGNIVTPKQLVAVSRKVSREGKLRCRVYGDAALKKMKMGAILAVGKGSEKESFLIEMEYRAPKAKRTICIVGKGLTFDSGGISLKPPDRMDEMKYDMCGAAATIGLMRAISLLKPPGVRVIGIVGTAENMPGQHAYKPGDVVKSGSGKTIEIINTDAEGRVVLADALHLATGFKPDAIIDMATLTGAILVALGSESAGLFCKDDGLARTLEAAGQRTGEKVWRMPTYEAYADKVKSPVADVRNSSGREAGSCTAAAFLFNFTKGFKHAHLDIAGTAWASRKRDYHVWGGTGFGVRLLYDALTHWGR